MEKGKVIWEQEVKYLMWGSEVRSQKATDKLYMLRWALIYLTPSNQAQLTGPSVRSLFSPASHLTSKALHLGKEVRQGQEAGFTIISAED